MAGNLTAMIAAAFSGGAAPPVTSDPYYEYTTLLLPGNGTNGAQNNTFLDGSTNNFTITRNGNTTQGTFSPFSQTGWGNYFNGSNYLSIATTSALQLSNSVAWTIELWLYATALPAVQSYPFMAYNLSSPYSGWGIGFNGGGTASPSTLQFWDGSSWRNIATGLTANTWYHIAISYEGSGTTGRFFLDGVQQGTAFAPSASINNTVSSVSLGAQNSGALGYTGYISNARIVKGTAVYTSNFTPPTAPLTAITNTSLLTCQSNRFIDNSTANSGSGFPITVNGSPTVVAFSPFNPSASWSAATNGGSGYFDGSGDYLSLADNAAFAMGTGNFTAEFWIYTQDQTNLYPGVISASIYNDTGAANIRYDNTGHANKIFVYLYGASPFNPAITSSTYAFGQWIHVALIRDSSTSLKLYVNGTIDGSLTISSGQEVDFSGANSFYVGKGLDTDGSNGYYAGYISGVRLVKGQALASGNFTPPSTPVTSSSVGWTGANAAASITGTVSFVSSFTNAGIYDATSRNDLETVGNAQISTAIPAKWGSGSMYFDGTGDYLTNNNYNSVVLPFGSGDFTLEGWVYTSSSANMGICQISTTSGGLQASQTNTVALYIFNYVFGAYYANIGKNGGTSISSSTWSHFALVRSSGTLKLYVNGTADSTFGSLSDTTNYTGGYIAIGGYYNASYLLNGYLQDFRITRYARYTTNFTAPTAAFPTL